VRSALQGIDGVQSVEISAYADIYTVTFRHGITPDEKTVGELFKGCAYNGRRVVIERDRRAAKDFATAWEPPAAPEDNPTNPTRVSLGKQLFTDKRLSADQTVSCAKCHSAKHAFTNGLAMAKGVGGRQIARNVPTLINVGYRRSLFWDGRKKTLEEMSRGAVEHPAVIDMTPEELTDRLRSIPEYVDLFQKEFGSPPTAETFALALAAYQRSLVSNDTPFDRFARGDENALSESARRGYFIFRDKANCVTCHSGPDFADGAFRFIGVGWNGKAYKDPGRAKVTGRPGEAGRFRVAPLRELVWTAPYMHDGSLKTLEEVVDFYDKNGPPGKRTDLHGPLKLTDQEKKDLVEFLRSLSSERTTVALRQ
jgi:cytochrome c peroxidase